MIAFMLGKFWFYLLPKPSRGRVWAFLNPGDFNIKEHVAIVIMAVSWIILRSFYLR